MDLEKITNGPTRFIVADVETFYDTLDGYSLTNMTTQEYIEDKRFQEIMWSACVVGKPQVKGAVGDANKLFKKTDWAKTAIVHHNAQFDGSILEEHHDIKPKHVFCTMAMAQTLGIGKITGSVSLANLATFFAVQEKQTYVSNMNGRRLESLTQSELGFYMDYCKTDSDICRKIFEIMVKYIPTSELLWHSLVNKMYTNPTLALNKDLLYEDLNRVITHREAQQQQIMDDLGFESLEAVQKELGSNNKFAALLEKEGVEPPMKQSPSNPEKQTLAFAKTDQGMKDLLEHINPQVKALAETRIGVKSNTEQTRIEKMIRIAELPSGKFRIPQKISGAHTHRLSGRDGLNVQNFPSGRVEGQSKALRQSIVSYVPFKQLAAPDSGQIEARILAYICNDKELLKVFSAGDCPYCLMAESIYRVDRHKIKKGDSLYKSTGEEKYKKYYMMRQVGKASVLQLGYAAGDKGFHQSLRDQYNVTTVNLKEASNIHGIYSDKRPDVVEMWGFCKDLLGMLVDGGSGYFGGPTGKLFYYTSNHDVFGTTVPGIRMPNGTWLTYPELHRRTNRESGYEEFAYIKNLSWLKRKPKKDETKQEQYYRQASRIWHGTIIENICQALAFAVLKWQALKASEESTIMLNVHDEYICPADDAENLKKWMETAPPWLKGMQFDCEYGIADNYGDT